MSIFESQKKDMGFPDDGQKVIFAKPLDNHWFINIVKDQDLLEVGKEYTVRKTELNSSSSYIWLEELEPYDINRDMPFFNLWSFNWNGKPESWFDKMKREKSER